MEEFLEHEATIEKTLIKHIGVDGLIHVAERVGGTRINIPLTYEGTQKNPHGFDEDVLKVLINLYGGTFVKFPLAKHFRILRMAAGGKSANEIARCLIMSQSQVQRVITQTRGQSRKLSSASRNLTKLGGEKGKSK